MSHFENSFGVCSMVKEGRLWVGVESKEDSLLKTRRSSDFIWLNKVGILPRTLRYRDNLLLLPSHLWEKENLNHLKSMLPETGGGILLLREREQASSHGQSGFSHTFSCKRLSGEGYEQSSFPSANETNILFKNPCPQTASARIILAFDEIPGAITATSLCYAISYDFLAGGRWELLKIIYFLNVTHLLSVIMRKEKC